jgi:GntR family transcriptional regulator/MocR family aminotransferase
LHRHVGSGTSSPTRIPARASERRKTRIAIEPPQQGPLALGCTHIDERALQRFRSFAGRRMRAFGAEHLQYGDPRGSRELRAAIADHLLSARGLRCDPDQIMLASGTQHALRIVLGAILKPGDHIWCEDPGYPAARRAIGHCWPAPRLRAGRRIRHDRGQRPDPRAVGGRGLRDAVAPVSARRADVDDAAAGTARLGKGGGAFVIEDDYDSEFRYDGAPLLSLAGIDHLSRVIYMGTFAKTLFPGLRIGYCALPERLVGPVTTARAALDRFPGTLLEGAVADMLNSGAFAANLRKVRGIYREARDVLASTLSAASDGLLTVPVPSQGLHLVARFDPSTDPLVAAKAKTRPASPGWLLAETYFRARPLPGFVLGFAGHPLPQLIASAERLAKSSLGRLAGKSQAEQRWNRQGQTAEGCDMIVRVSRRPYQNRRRVTKLDARFNITAKHRMPAIATFCISLSAC